MLKYYFRTLKSSWFILYIGVTALAMVKYQFYAQPLSIPVDYWIISNHVITMFVNNAFLLYSFVRTETLSRVKNLVVIRLKEKTTLFELMKISMLDLSIYLTLTYLMILMLNLETIVAPGQCLIFLSLNGVLFLMYESVFILSIMAYLPIVFNLVPFIMNILFHYTLVPMLFY